MKISYGASTLIVFFIVLHMTSTSVMAAYRDTTSFTVTRQWPINTCSFDEPIHTVFFDDIPAKVFINNTRTNSRNVKIGITCPLPPIVNVAAFGIADDDNPDLFKNTGSASGLGMKVYIDGTLARPTGDRTFTVMHSSGSRYYLPIDAGYVATKPGKVTGGSFVSVIKLRFEYL